MPHACATMPRRPCWSISAGSVSTGTKGPMSADLRLLIFSLNARRFTPRRSIGSRRRKACILARVHGLTLPGPPARLMPRTRDQPIPAPAPGESATDANFLADRSFAWRFRVPPGRVAWNNSFLGTVALDPSGIGGDFIVAAEHWSFLLFFLSARRGYRRRYDGSDPGDPRCGSGSQHAAADFAVSSA